ncbi:MAG: hypothetical protein HRU20_00730 [Pseudomonadales bacterium]|nr:hypothetical protein [Pseudomonadales bacterium]
MPFVPALALATEHKALILTPVLTQAYYQSIFNELIRGINDASSGNNDVVSVPEDSSDFAVDSWVNKYSPDFIISLGLRGWDAAATSSAPLPVVLGAVLSAPEVTHARLPELTVSLTPAPNKVFSRLKGLMPDVKTIYVVAHEDDHDIIQRALFDAKQMGLTLKVKQVKNLQESAIAHTQLMQSMQPAHDVLWLLQNPDVVDNRLILPMILKTAWKAKFAVVSIRSISPYSL